MPHQEPLLVAGCIESSISQSASELFGLELLQLDRPKKDARALLEERTDGSRPIITIATLGNECGEMDDFDAICQLSKDLPIYLHVDSSRTFDYMTTMSASDRSGLACLAILLRHPFKGHQDSSQLRAHRCCSYDRWGGCEQSISASYSYSHTTQPRHSN